MTTEGGGTLGLLDRGLYALFAHHAEDGRHASTRDRYRADSQAPPSECSFVLARPNDILHDVLKRLGHSSARIALVVSGEGIPRTGDIQGVIALDHVGQEVLQHFRG